MKYKHVVRINTKYEFLHSTRLSLLKLSHGFWAGICKIYFSKYVTPAGNSLIPHFKAYQTRKWNNFQNNPISAPSLPMNINQGFNATTSNSILNHPSSSAWSNIPTPSKQAAHYSPLPENNTGAHRDPAAWGFVGIGANCLRISSNHFSIAKATSLYFRAAAEGRAWGCWSSFPSWMFYEQKAGRGQGSVVSTGTSQARIQLFPASASLHLRKGRILSMPARERTTLSFSW